MTTSMRRWVMARSCTTPSTGEQRQQQRSRSQAPLPPPLLAGARSHRSFILSSTRAVTCLSARLAVCVRAVRSRWSLFFFASWTRPSFSVCATSNSSDAPISCSPAQVTTDSNTAWVSRQHADADCAATMQQLDSRPMRPLSAADPSLSVAVTSRHAPFECDRCRPRADCQDDWRLRVSMINRTVTAAAP